MDLNDYQKLALRTAPNFIGQSLNGIATYLNHAAQGFCTEIGEIFEAENSANYDEEVGDLMWYVSLACAGLGITLKDLTIYDFNADQEDAERMLVIQIGRFTDVIKRNIQYGKELDCSAHDKMVQALSWITTAAMTLLASENEFDDCLERNIEKLRIRFPDKFDADKALNRNLKKESEVFTG